MAPSSSRRTACGTWPSASASSAGFFPLDERLETVTTSAKEMIQPTVYGQAIIILVYVPLLTFTGVEGKTFMPMAMTVIIALATAFVLSLTFVPAMIAIAVTGRVQEKENLFVRGLKALYQPALASSHSLACAGDRRCGPAVRGRGAVVHAPWSGVHADPRREEHRHGGQANSEHVAFAIAVHAARQRDYGWPISTGRLRLLAHRHARPRRRSDAAERVRHLHHLEAARAVARSRPIARRI